MAETSPRYHFQVTRRDASLNYITEQFQKLKSAQQPVQRADVKTILPLKWAAQERMAADIFSRVSSGSSVLEVGCGGSLTLHFLSEAGHVVTGIDKDHCMIEYSAYLCNVFGSSAKLQICDAFSLPFKPNCFDYVYSIGMIEHYEDAQTQQLLVNEMVRVARRYIHIETPNPHPHGAFFWTGASSQDPHYPCHPGILLSNAGCRIVNSDARGMVTPERAAIRNPDYLTSLPRYLLKDKFDHSDIERIIALESSSTREQRLLYGFQLLWVAEKIAGESWKEPQQVDGLL